MVNEDIRVVYIGGDGRSGSTLCEHILGQFKGAIAVGELRHIWEKSFARDELCSCGRPFSQCEFWQAVIADVWGGYHLVPLQHILQLKQSVDRIRFIPQMFLPGQHAYHQRFVEYAQLLVELYRSIGKISGAGLIIDASKDPSTAYVLRNIREIDLSIVHLVRDSRAVGYSWQRKRVRPEVVCQTAHMATYSPRSASFSWLYRNLLIQGLASVSVPYVRIHYEDLIDDPQGTIEHIAQVVGLPIETYEFIHGREVQLRPGHTVAGNPSRFRHGLITLNLDAEWVSQLKRRDKWVITTLTAPLLQLYHYPLRC